MAKKPVSPVQLALQVTFFLKGDLKRERKLFILIASKLARIRDEQMWKALKHPSIEDYAQKRLQMERTSLYHYLQIHKWLERDHPAWLGKKPKGFIPGLTGSSALMWIENYLHDKQPTGVVREELESMRRQALRGTLTDKEFRALRRKIRPTVAPLRGALRRMESLRDDADHIDGFPAAARKALEEAIRAIEEALGSTQHVAKLLSPPAIALARAELDGDSTVV